MVALSSEHPHVALQRLSTSLLLLHMLVDSTQLHDGRVSEGCCLLERTLQVLTPCALLSAHLEHVLHLSL